MLKISKCFKLSMVALCFVCAIKAPAKQNTEKIRNALEELEAQLGPTENGEKWRNILHLKELYSEINKGSGADSATVGAILKLFQENEPRFNQPYFSEAVSALSYYYFQLSKVEKGRVLQLIEDAKKGFVPITASDIELAKLKLFKAMKAVQVKFEKADPQVWLGWQDFLNWPELEKISNQNSAPSKENLEVLKKLSIQFNSAYPGFELEELIMLRRAIRALIDLATFSDKSAQNAYMNIINRLQNSLVALENKTSDENEAEVAKYLRLLERSNQAKNVVDNIRYHYSKPNVLLNVSNKFVSAAINMNIDEPTKINENIRGTRTYGNGFTHGTTTAVLVDNAEKGELELWIQGKTDSDNVGYNGPATIVSKGLTSIIARKRLIISPFGISACPAVARCNTQSSIQTVRANGGPIINRIASNRVEREKPASEYVASRIAETRAASMIDDKTREQVEKANVSINHDFVFPLKRRDSLPPVLNLSSNQDFLNIEMLQAGQSQLGATSGPPAFKKMEDVNLRLHQSYINNLAETLLGGETFTGEEVEKRLKDSGGFADSNNNKSFMEDKDWKITFEDLRPVRIEFDNGKVSIALRLKEFTNKENAVQAIVQISASYQIQTLENGYEFIRDGEIVVKFLSPHPLQADLQNVLKKRFEQLFKPSFKNEGGFYLPGQLKKIGKLKLENIDSSNNWILLEWRII